MFTNYYAYRSVARWDLVALNPQPLPPRYSYNVFYFG